MSEEAPSRSRPWEQAAPFGATCSRDTKKGLRTLQGQKRRDGDGKNRRHRRRCRDTIARLLAVSRGLYAQLCVRAALVCVVLWSVTISLSVCVGVRLCGCAKKWTARGLIPLPAPFADPRPKRVHLWWVLTP